MPLKEFIFPSDDPDVEGDAYRYLPHHTTEYWKAYRKKRKLNGNPVKTHYTKQVKVSKFNRAHFVAWDGEGVSDENGIHRYTLLANSEGHRLYNKDGISTKDALNFLCSEGRKYRNSIHVVFAGGYDINMILGDLTERYDLLEQLNSSNCCVYEDFFIMHTPKKKFIVNKIAPYQDLSRVDMTHSNKGHIKGLRYVGGVCLWDSFGFFQGSFVAALENWLGPENVPELDIIKDMKQRRSEFTDEDSEEVQKYNNLELDYLVKMMRVLRKACAEADLIVKQWHGAGAVAEAWLEKHNIKFYIGELPAEVQEAAQYAYSGGRIEPLFLGNAANKRIYRYDINSAYPSQMPKLPCLIHGEWIRSPGPPLSEFSLIHIHWDLPKHRPFYPFFLRKKDGSILYPRSGEGWYWYPEFMLEQDVYIQESLSYITKCECKPFIEIPRTYDYRLRLKEEKNAAEKAIKLGMNALYGKFVQKAGYERGGRIPKYHSIAWGGYITSATRAQLYTAAMQHPESVLMFATDALFSMRKHDLPCSTKLGEWDYAMYYGITIAQAGVYWLLATCKYCKGKKCSKCDNTGKLWGEKYRGFDPGSLDRERILTAWTERLTYEASLTRFIGLGSAMTSTRYFQLWRTWQTQKRELHILPTGKRISIGNFDYSRGLFPTQPAMTWNPGEMSYKYHLPWEQNPIDNEWDYQMVDGVPLDIVRDELEDMWAE